MKNITAFAWASGLIQFTTPKRRSNVPEGAIAIARGPSKRLRAAVIRHSRLGQGASSGKYLVPGVPEAELMQIDPVDALIEFSKRVRGCLLKKS
jgi:hypothetical protein